MDSEKCKINFRCPESWDELNTTDDPLVRYCDKCAKDVHYCATEGELELADEEWCVAVPVDVLGGSEVMVGDIDFADFKDQFSEPQPEDLAQESPEVDPLERLDIQTQPEPCKISDASFDAFLNSEPDSKK